MARPRGVARTSSTDNYSTPEWATHALLDYLGTDSFLGITLEPACGEGAMVKVLRERGLVVNAADVRIASPKWWELSESVTPALADFLDPANYGTGICDHVITNPPFKTAGEFVDRALVVARKSVAMFLRLQFLESAERYRMLLSSPLKWVLVFSSRVSLWPEGEPPPEWAKRGGTASYAWFVWEHGYNQRPQIGWIPPRRRR